jgi:hypothetical protein
MRRRRLNTARGPQFRCSMNRYARVEVKTISNERKVILTKINESDILESEKIETCIYTGWKKINPNNDGVFIWEYWEY